MQTINAIYDGAIFRVKQPIPVKGQYKVVITFIEPLAEPIAGNTPITKRSFSELRGFLKGKVRIADDFNAPLEEMKEYME